MSQPTTQRPPQVTTAVGIVMVSSVIVLLTAYERVTTLGSLDTQEAIRAALAAAPLSSFDLSANEATGLLRITCMVAAACACATGIFGWYARRPDRSARLGLSVFAVPVFLTSLPAGGLAGSFVAAGTAMLWMQPAREWFTTGRWTPPEPVVEPDRPQATAPREVGARWRTEAPPPAAGPMVPPPAARPYGEPGPNPYVHAPVPPVDPGYRSHPGYPGHAGHRVARPSAMVAAFVITVVTAGGLLVLSLLWLAIAGLAPELLRDVLEQRPDLFGETLTFADIRRAMLAQGVLLGLWAAIALTLAGFAMARREWARRGLMVSAAVSAVGCLLLAVAAPVTVVFAAIAVAAVVCLGRAEVRRWFAVDAAGRSGMVQ